MRPLLAIPLLVFAACGFSPQDSFTGQRAGDGIAPWKDFGPIQICLGNEFIGPPASSPGGMCSPQSVVAAPCLIDADCRSRESCVCGSCRVKYCTVNSDCGIDRVCSFGQQRCDRPCLVTDDCPFTDECFNSTCRGRCLSDAECQTGEVCNSQNWCITDPCADDSDCMDEELCQIQRVPRIATEPTLMARSRSGEPAFTMWLELSDEFVQDQRAIWRATSGDGVHFTVDPARPVLEDGNAARAPSVIRTATGYILYYQYGDGEALKAASSADGAGFDSVSTVLQGGTGNAAVRAPTALLLGDGRVAVYYELGTGISLATGAPGDSLETAGAALRAADVEDPPDNGTAPQFWIDIQAVRSPVVATTVGAGGSSPRMWFSAYGQESADSLQYGEEVPIEPTYSIGYATIDAGDPATLTVWPFNPVLDRVVAFTAHRSELAPAVVQVTDDDGQPKNGYLLYYLDAETEGPDGPFTLERIGVAGNGDY